MTEKINYQNSWQLIFYQLFNQMLLLYYEIYVTKICNDGKISNKLYPKTSEHRTGNTLFISM